MDDSCITQQADNDLDKAIYIIKYDDKSFGEMHKSFCLDNEITINNYKNSPEINKFLAGNPDYKIESINKTCFDAGGLDLLAKIKSFSYSRKNKDIRTEAVINKYKSIYPSLP